MRLSFSSGCSMQFCGSDFFHPGSRVDKIPNPESGFASKSLSIFNSKVKTDTKNKKRDVHPGSWLYKKHRIPDLDPQHWSYVKRNRLSDNITQHRHTSRK
jgi:hypothetical protein